MTANTPAPDGLFKSYRKQQILATALTFGWMWYAWPFISWILSFGEGPMPLGRTRAAVIVGMIIVPILYFNSRIYQLKRFRI